MCSPQDCFQQSFPRRVRLKKAFVRLKDSVRTSITLTELEPLVVWSSCAVLVAAAGSKLWTVVSDLRILEVYDPIFLVPNRYLLLGVAILELVCSFGVLKSHNSRSKGLILTWLAANFIAYHVALALSGAPPPCPCLGSVGAQLGLSREEAEALMKAMGVYIMVCGIFLFFQHGPARVAPGSNSTGS